MNDRQLDMVLGYLNEGTEIDIDEYKIEQLYEEALLESNADVNDTYSEYKAKLRKLTREYNKALKDKNKEELTKVHNEYISTVNEFEKEINSIKVTKGDAAKGVALLVAGYAALLYFIKNPFIIKLGKISMAGGAGATAILQIKTIVKEVKKNGLTADSLNIYKTNAKILIDACRKGMEKAYKKDMEKLNKEK